MKRKRQVRKPKRQVRKLNCHVAVVVKQDGSSSSRPLGDWACFTGEERNYVIEEALKALAKWSSNEIYGPYEVLVGRLSMRVVVPTKYKLVNL